jgi:hypothetical protein
VGITSGTNLACRGCSGLRDGREVRSKYLEVAKNVPLNTGGQCYPKATAGRPRLISGGQRLMAYSKVTRGIYMIRDYRMPPSTLRMISILRGRWRSKTPQTRLWVGRMGIMGLQIDDPRCWCDSGRIYLEWVWCYGQPWYTDTGYVKVSFPCLGERRAKGLCSAAVVQGFSSALLLSIS